MFRNVLGSESYIGLGTVLRMGTLAWPYPAYQGAYPYQDGIIFMLDHSLLRLGYVNTRYSLGMFSQDVDPFSQTSEILGLPPSEAEHVAAIDFERYGNPLSSLQRFLRNYTGFSGLLHEHEVQHVTYDGVVTNDVGLPPTWVNDSSYRGTNGFAFPLLKRVNSTYRPGPSINIDAAVSLGSAVSFSEANTHSSIDYQRPYHFFDELFMYLVETVGDYYQTGEVLISGWYNSCEYFKITHNYVPFSTGNFSLSYEYSHKVRRTTGTVRAQRVTWLVELDFTIQFPSVVPTSYAPGQFTLLMLPVVTVHRRFTRKRFDVWYNSGMYVHGAAENAVVVDDDAHLQATYGTYWTQPGSDHASGQADLDSYRFGILPSRLQQFRYEVLHDMKNIRPSSTYAAFDALQNYSTTLSANHIETLSELGSILSLIPDLGLLVQAIRDLKRLNLGRGAKKLGDFLASTNLKWNFGWEPTVAAIEEINSKSSEILTKLDEIGEGGLTNIYGSFYYELPFASYSGSSHVLLISRSKLRVQFAENALLGTLLGMRSVGLLPSAGALWDLVPFSFVVDWATGMGDRISDLDSQALMLMCDVKYCVHSYAIYSFESAELLAQYKLKSGSDLEPFAKKYYERHVSAYAPMLRYSKYDFRQATGPHDAGVVGSLLWTILS